MYKVQQKAKKQQLTVWNCGPVELDDILMQYTELEHSFNVIHNEFSVFNFNSHTF